MFPERDFATFRAAGGAYDPRLMRGRATGILLHPTSLPGPRGTGDLGPEASRFLQTLAGAGVGVWQMLPLTVPGPFGSPYDGRSAFAGDPRLISPDRLVEEGLLERRQAGGGSGDDSIDALFRLAWQAFVVRGSSAQRDSFEAFRTAEEQRSWLDDWALFAALDAKLAPGPWHRWPEELARRDPSALAHARRELADEIGYRQFLQWLFDRQFAALQAEAGNLGVGLLGDLPIYPAHHSADVWAHPELFELAEDGAPVAVAGVPPDAFTDDGQLWGNPVYRWDRHRESDFLWWRRRIRLHARRFDLLRLDHFRGFLAWWRTPLPTEDARGGSWQRGPGRALFRAVEPELGGLEFIAEDLGVITPAVRKLRRDLGLPGTRVLQFGFDEEESEHHPERYGRDTVAYSGTHDNATLRGWLATLDSATRVRVESYAGGAAADDELAQRLIARLLESRAELVVLPLQDVLGLEDAARMNVPGTTEGNWNWRLDRALEAASLERLGGWIADSGRRREGRRG